MSVVRVAVFTLAALLLLQKSTACDSADQCDFPYNNPYTTHAAGFAGPCCRIMQPIPLAATGASPGNATVIAPPEASDDTHCPSLPEQVVPIRYPGDDPSTKVFMFGGLTWDDPPNKALGTLPKDYSHTLGACGKPHPFYTQYTNAYADDVGPDLGVPIIASSAAPPEAVLKAGQSVAEMLSLLDHKVPGIRAAMSGHYQRLAVWANSERRLDTCEYCKKQDPTYNCNGHFDARAGYDTSLHPEVALCQEGGGADKSMPTTFVEEYGICFLNSTGGVPDSYCGTNIVLHEFFHSIHEVAIKWVDPAGFVMIMKAAKRAIEEGIYVHHPNPNGTSVHDGCRSDLQTCEAFEFMVKAHLTWNGFPAAKAEFRYRSRAEIKQKAPWMAKVIYRFFPDGDWNACRGHLALHSVESRFQQNTQDRPWRSFFKTQRLCGPAHYRKYTDEFADLRCKTPATVPAVPTRTRLG